MHTSIEKQLQMLNRLYKESDGIYRGLATAYGLSETAFWILYAISHAEKPFTQNDIYEEWYFPVQTINSAISKLAKTGFVKLEAIPGTRNRKQILLTEEGRKFVSNTISRVDEIESRAFSRFSEEERELYLSLFIKHVNNLKEEEQKAISSLEK